MTNHQLFEDMLLEPRALTVSQSESLEVHLQTCPSCRSLANGLGMMDSLFGRSEVVLPQAGFPNRFAEKLGRRRRNTARWQTFSALLLVSIGLMTVMLFMGFEFVNYAIPLSSTVLRFILALLDTLGYISLAVDFLWLLLENTLGKIPLVFWFIVTYVMSGLCLIWLTSLYKIGFQNVRKE